MAASASQTPATGIADADKIINLALAYGLTVTVNTTEREDPTTYLVRFEIPIPAAYAGKQLGRAIAAAGTLTMIWTKSNRKGARGRFEEATVWSAEGSRPVPTVPAVTACVERLGDDANKYDAVPSPKDVIDVPHALHIDGELRREGIPAEHMRRIVSNRRSRGHLVHQDEQGAICIDNRRYVPQTPLAVDPYEALVESLYEADMTSVTYDVTASEDGTTRSCPSQDGKRLRRAVGIKHSYGARVEGDAERFTVDWRGVANGPGEIVFTCQRAPLARTSERVKVSELEVGDVFVTRCAWTVLAIDGGTFTAVSNEGQKVTQTVPEDTMVLRVRRASPPRPASDAPQRLHMRTVNDGTTEVIPTRDALAEINHAMMDGKGGVREMSASRSSARIVYKDNRGTVELRPLDEGQRPDVQERRPTTRDLTGPIDDAHLAFLAQTYAAVADRTAIPVRADMLRPGMDVIAAVRREDRTVDTAKHYNGPSRRGSTSLGPSASTTTA
ncbi:hypothetical protein [Streptomyces sp. NPDC059003]|uniref:hypothetical protein n=1 Tax=Streptomyces sp. NPDC059003 TaxID=3346691 RepID=UPI0036954DD9